MKNPVFLEMALMTLLIGISSCHVDHGTQVTGGKGGNMVIMVTLTNTHVKNGGLIKNFKAYIKYAAISVPANGVYDDSAYCALLDTTYAVVFSNLKPGEYYLFASGEDTTQTNSLIKAGDPVTISSQDTTKILLPAMVL